MKRLLLCVLVTLVFAPGPTADAQPLTSLYSVQSPNQQNHGYFGRSVESIEDADGDGIRDLLVAAYNEAGNTGCVYYLSGAGGAPIRTFTSPNAQANGYFGVSIAPTGDVNGDGTPDFLAGSYHPVGGRASAGRAYVISGAVRHLGLLPFDG